MRMASAATRAGPDPSADRSACVRAGVLAGLAGLTVFLALHHVWITPIWFVAPVGALMAAACGAAVGAAYAELRPRLPRRPWTSIVVPLGVVAILAPSVVLAELGGPVYAMGGGDAATVLVPASVAIAAFVALLVTATVVGAGLGWIVGRTPRAAGRMALAGFALGIGPGHNIPLLGATPAVTKELVILAVVTATASVVLVLVARSLEPDDSSRS